jgi:hypothetical protein
MLSEVYDNKTVCPGTDSSDLFLRRCNSLSQPYGGGGGRGSNCKLVVESLRPGYKGLDWLLQMGGALKMGSLCVWSTASHGTANNNICKGHFSRFIVNKLNT